MIKKIVLTAAAVGTVVYVGKKIADRTGLTDKVVELVEASVARGVSVLGDALTAYDQWTNNLVGDDENAAQKNSDDQADTWSTATRSGI